MTQEVGNVEKNKTENPRNTGTEEQKVGYKNPPKNRQFGQPEGNKPSTNGSWKKTDTPRYKMEQLLKMSREELIEVVKDDSGKLGFFEQAIAKNILELGGNSSPQNMGAMNSLVNQVYGMPKEQKDITSNGQQITGLEIGFKDYTEKKEKADGKEG